MRAVCIISGGQPSRNADIFASNRAKRYLLSLTLPHNGTPLILVTITDYDAQMLKKECSLLELLSY